MNYIIPYINTNEYLHNENMINTIKTLFLDVFALVIMDSPLCSVNFTLINRIGDQIRGNIVLGLSELTSHRSVKFGKARLLPGADPEKKLTVDNLKF